jgi:hypothetical protein
MLPFNLMWQCPAIATTKYVFCLDSLNWAQVPEETVPGGIYDIASDAWQRFPEEGAPRVVENPAVAWTDAELVVWGGRNTDGPTNEGARFNPATSAWRPMTTANAPPPMQGPRGVWTGKQLFVWGQSALDSAATGGLYDPELNEWQAVSQQGAPSGPGYVVWTGKNVIVLGGKEGGIYDPSGNTWRPTMPFSPFFASATGWDGCRVLLAGGIGKVYIYEPPADD